MVDGTLARSTGRALYLETEPDSVLAFVHVPEDADPRRPGVVFCPPFGWDDICSYRSRRKWADALAVAGYPALRFDLPSTGDSAGSPRSAARLDAWVAATTGAAAWLRDETGCERVVAIGLGLGGTIAWLSAARGAPIDDLVLWGVAARGRTALRELNAFARLKAAEFPDPDAEAPPELPEDWLEVAGFVMSAETTRALRASDLTAEPLGDPAARRLLVLGRDGISADARLREHIESSGAELTVADGTGWGAMTSNPQEARAPLATIARVSEWLAAAPARARAPATGTAAAGPAPIERARLQLDLDGSVVTERPLLIDQPFGRLFGVLTEPPAGTPAAPFALVLLNGGAVRHIGPNRMWVEVARRWAARGLPVLRIDIEGLGESDGDESHYVDSAELYAPRLSEQVLVATRELSRLGVTTRFVAIGLCAGASWAFHSLLPEAGVDAAIMVNLFAFFWDDWLVAERDARKVGRLLQRSSWRRLLRRDVERGRMISTARWLARTPLELRARRARRRRQITQLDDAFDRVRDSGKRMLLLVGRGEPIYEQFEREGRLQRLDRWPNFELRRIPGRDHTFRSCWLQENVHAQLDIAIEEEMARVSTRESAARERMAAHGG